MGKFSRDKGKRGELDWSHYCNAHGYKVTRTAQNRGKTGAAGDCEGLPYLHQEIKFVERLNIREALAQSERDAKAEQKGNIPIVAHKMSRKPWTVTLYAEDFLKIYKVFAANYKPQ
jgi:hypothetical protein